MLLSAGCGQKQVFTNHDNEKGDFVMDPLDNYEKMPRCPLMPATGCVAPRCYGVYCAWYDSRLQQCVIASLSDALEHLADELG